MKTTLRCLALAGALAAAGAALHRQTGPSRLIFQAPGQEEFLPPPAGSATLRGQVLHDGAGVAGALVRLIPSTSKGSGPIVTSRFTLQTRTDVAGRFEIPGAPEGPARLAVLADGFAPSITTLDVPAELTVVLEDGVAMEGIVADGKAAVPGARVSVSLAGRDSEVERRPLREGVTDAEGRFRLAGLDPSRPLRLVILSERHRPYEKSLRSPLDATDRIDLDPGLETSGRILTAAGDPVAGTEVTASQGEGYTAAARSGTAGDVRIGGLIPRAVAIRVLVEGYAPAKLDLPGPGAGWTIHLKRTGGVAGRAPAGSWLVIATGNATYRRSIGDDGRFHWEGLPPGPAEARATDLAGNIMSSSRVEIPEGGIAGGILLMP
jgi:hypothetical protein